MSGVKRRLALAVIPTLLLAAVSCSDGGSSATTASTAGTEEGMQLAEADTGAWGRLIAELDGAEPTAQQALDWYVTLSGSDIPGATAKYGSVEGLVSYTHVLHWFEELWDEFTPDQQAALTADFAFVDGPPTTATGGSSAAGRIAGAEPAWLRQMLVDANEQVSTLLGHRIDMANVVTRHVAAAALGTAMAEAGGNPARVFGRRVSSECLIAYGDALLAAPRSQQLSALAHELTHCHQHDASTAGSADAHKELPTWYVEGSAGWIGEVVAGNSGLPAARTWWSSYFYGNARTPAGLVGYSFLGDSTGYTAIGMFQWAAERTSTAAIAGGLLTHMNESTEDKLNWLFGTAGTPEREQIAAKWAAQASRRTWSANWNMNGVGLGALGLAGAGRTLNALQLRPGMELAGQGNAGSQLTAISLSIVPTAQVDLIAVGVTGWSVVTGGGAGEKFSTAARLAQVYCVGEACSCRSARAGGVEPVRIERGTSVAIAMASDVGIGVRWSIKGYDLPDDGSDCDPCPEAGAARPSHSPADSPTGVAAPPDPVCGGTVPVATTEETGDGGGCLVGTWQVNNTVMSATFLRTVSTPGGGAPPSDFTHSEVTGTWVLTLGADGSMTMTATNWALKGTIAGPPGLGVNPNPMIDITVTFNGTVTGRWTASGSSFTVSRAAGQLGAKSTASFAGQTFDVTGPNMASLPLAGNSTSTYACGGGMLVLTPNVANAMALTFESAG